MNRNDQKFIVEKIRTQYTEKEHTSLDELKALDAKVKCPANVFAYIFGTVGAIIMGSGMSLVMTDIAQTVGIENSMVFPQLDILQVSEFYMVRVESEDMAVERIVMVPTTGIPEERENAVVNSVVKDKRTFVEYVAFVLGDSYLLSLMEERTLAGAGSWNSGHESLPALYEKMLKTALEEPEKIGEIGYLLQMITKEDIVPDEFRELYATFKKTLRLK